MIFVDILRLTTFRIYVTETAFSDSASLYSIITSPSVRLGLIDFELTRNELSTPFPDYPQKLPV